MTAPAIDGKANRALIKLLAKGLGVAKSAVVIANGHKDRDKVLAVAGPPSDPADLRRRLDVWLTAKGITLGG